MFLSEHWPLAKSINLRATRIIDSALPSGGLTSSGRGPQFTIEEENKGANNPVHNLN